MFLFELLLMHTKRVNIIDIIIVLKMLRKQVGLTQANLAKKLKISPSTIGMYEQGRREPDSEMLVKIAELFNVSVDYLIGFRRENSKETINSIIKAVREGIHRAFEDKD